ncbi:hypothetical protein [Paenibacillus hexagrammi]|nr:hypothetical protein [Paenibacillus sp. YPD9-1]
MAIRAASSSKQWQIRAASSSKQWQSEQQAAVSRDDQNSKQQ